mmetsp:Transcript_13371/g.22399  ORF Transcript_13371/g.22399 Transcript_13371/m.22399 type:complete len:711 (+) Transcript_13371:37-2169(+)
MFHILLDIIQLVVDFVKELWSYILTKIEQRNIQHNKKSDEQPFQSLYFQQTSQQGSRGNTGNYNNTNYHGYTSSQGHDHGYGYGYGYGNAGINQNAYGFGASSTNAAVGNTATNVRQRNFSAALDYDRSTNQDSQSSASATTLPRPFYGVTRQQKQQQTLEKEDSLAVDDQFQSSTGGSSRDGNSANSSTKNKIDMMDNPLQQRKNTLGKLSSPEREPKQQQPNSNEGGSHSMGNSSNENDSNSSVSSNNNNCNDNYNNNNNNNEEEAAGTIAASMVEGRGMGLGPGGGVVVSAAGVGLVAGSGSGSGSGGSGGGGGLKGSRPLVKVVDRMSMLAQRRREGKGDGIVGAYPPDSFNSSSSSTNSNTREALMSVRNILQASSSSSAAVAGVNESSAEAAATGGGVDGSEKTSAVDILLRNITADGNSGAGGKFPTLSLKDLSLLHVVGGGGFGQVWKGTWGGTPVAVKLLSNLCQNTQQQLPDQLLQAFEEEVGMLAQLRHPNICLFLGVCLEPPSYAIVTELVSRGSLWDALRIPGLFQQRDLPWPVGIMRRVLEGTVRGLIYLHSHTPPIIHRDLKSANLLLDETFNVKICDFGLARLRDYNTVLTANVGTIHWMAPEVLTGTQYCESADIYSVGIVMWELFTGQCPYETMKQVEVALSVVQRGLRPVIPHTCTSAQAAIIRKCWATDPSSRFTAQELLQEIDTAYPLK